MTTPDARGVADATRLAVGSFAAVLALALLGSVGRWPLLIAPFAATTALVLALPHVPLSRPRTIVSGYLVCTAPALALVAAGLPTMWSESIAVGLGVLGMRLTGTMHPPAAAMPILIGATHPTPDFLLTPVLLGAVLLAALAAFYRRLVAP